MSKRTKSNKEWYIQCSLVKDIDHNSRYLTCFWIPEKYAVINKVLKIKKGKIWENDWKVLYVFPEIKKDIEELTTQERDFMRQRKVSDI